MYKIIRFNLQIVVLTALYCVAVAVYLVPLAGYLVAFLVIISLVRHRRVFTSGGTARWAMDDDVQHMREGSGLILGYFQGAKGLGIKALFSRWIDAKAACQRFLSLKPPRYLIKLTKAVHTAIFAPTGVGKGVSCVIPFLLTCKDSCVVVDVKDGEAAKLTAKARRKMGHRVILLDPFKRITDTPDTLNPLEFVDIGLFAIDDCREIAAALVDRQQEKGDGLHFLDNAEGGIAGVSALVSLFGEGNQRSLQAVCDITSSPDKWKKSIELMCQSDAWGGCLARMGGNLLHLIDRELGSTMSTIARFTRFLSTPAIAASTRSSSFDPAEVLNGKTTVFLILPPERVIALAPLLRLWLGTFIRAVVRGGLQEKVKVHLVCDEAGSSLGKMDQIANALTVGRGMGLRLQLYYQDLGQLKKCWPDGAHQTVLANCSQLFFGINDLETAQYCSSRLGEETIIVTDGGSGTSKSRDISEGKTKYTYSSNTSANWKQMGRHLLKPEEVLNLPERVGICFTQGCPPIWTWLTRYYEKDFKQPGRFWPAVKAFAQSVALLVAVGALAVGMTLIANERKSVSARVPMVVPDVPAQSDVQFFPQEEER